MSTHSSLTGSNLHEPEQSATGVNGYVFIADGQGSGAWDVYPYDDLSYSTYLQFETVADFQTSTGATTTTEVYDTILTFTVPQTGTMNVKGLFNVRKASLLRTPAYIYGVLNDATIVPSETVKNSGICLVDNYTPNMVQCYLKSFDVTEGDTFKIICYTKGSTLYFNAQEEVSLRSDLGLSAANKAGFPTAPAMRVIAEIF